MFIYVYLYKIMFNNITYKNYKRNIFNYENLYPVSSNTSLNKRLFYNLNYKEIVYNSNYDPANTSQASTSASSYTMPSYNLTLIATASSNSIAITLPTAIGISGVIYKIVRTDTTFANPITITTTASQTIGGSGTSRTMYTANEVWEFVSNGTNWTILNHNAKTPFVNYGAITFTSTGTAPGIPTSSYHKLQWRRDGKFIYIYYGITPTSVPTIGTGTYLFPILPTALSGLTIDTSINATYTGGTPGNVAWSFTNIPFLSVSSTALTSSSNAYGISILYDQYNIRVFSIKSHNTTPTVGINGPEYYPLISTSGVRFTITAVIPITEFND